MNIDRLARGLVSVALHAVCGGLWLAIGVVLSRPALAGTEPDLVAVKVRQVGFDHTTNSPLVILEDHEGTMAMPIWIGMAEAQAIALQIQGVSVPRPLTHDLIKTMLDRTGILVERIVVSELRGRTYYASIFLTKGNETLEIDSRPSDAIALALRADRPIFVARSLFNGVAPDAAFEQALVEPVGRIVRGVLVQDLTAALARHFGQAGSSGVLVADVGDRRGEPVLFRGDVILSADGEVISSTAQFEERLRNNPGPVALRVWRHGEDVSVQWRSRHDLLGGR